LFDGRRYVRCLELDEKLLLIILGFLKVMVLVKFSKRNLSKLWIGAVSPCRTIGTRSVL
jgi:hypothetical protein